MKLINFAVCFLLLNSVVPSTTVLAHGGGGTSHDTCYFNIGKYYMGFVGYQPESNPKEKYCDSLPGLGSTVLAFDFFQPGVRKLKTGVRIVKVSSPLLADQVSAEDTENTIVVEVPAMHPQGLLTINHTFEKPGYFVALVTIEDSEGREHLGRFPFSVAAPSKYLQLFVVGGTIVALAILILLLRRMRIREERAV